jgi:superfamily II helicase
VGEYINAALKYIHGRVTYNYSPDDRLMVFCRTCNCTNKIAACLQLKTYHSLTPEGNWDKIFNDWVQGKTQIIVTTSILSAGVDQRVRDSITIDQPWDWINNYQAGNSAGHNGMRAQFVYYLPDNLTPYNAAKPFRADLFLQWAYNTVEC